MKRVAAFVASVIVTSTLLGQEIDLREALLSPLPVRDQFLLGSGFFSFTPESARPLADQQWSIAINAADSNTFAKSAWISRSLEGRTMRTDALKALADSRFESAGTLFFVDGESHRSDIALSRGFASGLELRVSVPLISTGGGWSDPIIESAHHAMKIGNAERESLVRNSETVFLRHDGLTYVRSRGNGISVGDIALSAKYELTPFEERHTNLSLVGGVEVPTGNARTLDGSGSFDTGVELVASRDFDRTRVSASLGVVRLGMNAALGLRSQFLVADSVSVSHLVGRSAAAIVQITVSESPFRQLGVPEFSRRSYQLSTGMQRRIGGVVVHAGFIENVISFENSADAGLVWGVSRRF